MKIVIEISEKDYFDFLLQYANGILDEKTPSHRAKIAIANGIPLPKGHGRIVDMNEALDVLAIEWGYEGIDDDLESKVPTIIEADKEGAEE